MIRVLVACEFSGTVRDAFLACGHDAWSNDIIDAESGPERHLKMDVKAAIRLRRWDLIIIHIPCTAMAVCGNGTYGAGKPSHHERLEAIEWSIEVWDEAIACSKHVAMENPGSVLFPELRNRRGADVQYIHPWQHGHMEQKKTGLALHDLPRIVETNNVRTEMMKLPVKERERIWFMSPGPDRAKERARFYRGFASAMSHQWGEYVSTQNRLAA